MSGWWARCRHFFLFVGGGGVSAVVDIGLLQLFLVLGASAWAAVSAGFSAGLIVNYLFHMRVTFQSSSSVKRVGRFMLVVAMNYLITLAFVHLFDVLLGVGVIAGKVASLPIVAANGFLLSKYWVFKK